MWLAREFWSNGEAVIPLTLRYKFFRIGTP